MSQLLQQSRMAPSPLSQPPLIQDEDIPSFMKSTNGFNGTISTNPYQPDLSTLTTFGHSQPHTRHPNASMQDLSLSAILAASTGGASRVPASSSSPPLVAAALETNSSKTQQQLYELQLQQMVLAENQQALEQSVREAEIAAAHPSGSSFLQNAMAVPTDANYKSKQPKNKKKMRLFSPEEEDDLEVDPATDFYLYQADPKAEAEERRLQQLQVTRTKLIEQQDQILDQQQALLERNTAALTKSIQAGTKLLQNSGAAVGATPSSMSYLDPTQIREDHSSSPSRSSAVAAARQSPSAQVIQADALNSERVWDEVDEVLQPQPRQTPSSSPIVRTCSFVCYERE